MNVRATTLSANLSPCSWQTTSDCDPSSATRFCSYCKLQFSCLLCSEDRVPLDHEGKSMATWRVCKDCFSNGAMDKIEKARKARLAHLQPPPAKTSLSSSSLSSAVTTPVKTTSTTSTKKRNLFGEKDLMKPVSYDHAAVTGGLRFSLLSMFVLSHYPLDDVISLFRLRSPGTTATLLAKFKDLEAKENQGKSDSPVSLTPRSLS